MDFCVLCRYSGGSNACVNEVNQYILQNISVLDIEEIARQTSETLSKVLELPCTPDLIKRHIYEHTHEPKIVVNLLLRDVRHVLDDVRKSSSVVDADGVVTIDKNNMLVYLKTVEVAASLAMRLH
jgi:hypothetical protein